MIEVQFTCEHCGEPVPYATWKGELKPRNHCPRCLWSKHVASGDEFGYPPCGAMQRGVDVGGHEVVWRCLGCGMVMRGPTDDYMYSALASSLVRSIQLTIYPREA